MFATTVFFDKCGIGLQFSSIEPKWFVVKKAREYGLSIGKIHLCPECRDGNRKEGEQNEVD